MLSLTKNKNGSSKRGLWNLSFGSIHFSDWVQVTWALWKGQIILTFYRQTAQQGPPPPPPPPLSQAAGSPPPFHKQHHGPWYTPFSYLWYFKREQCDLIGWLLIINGILTPSMTCLAEILYLWQEMFGLCL